MGFVEAILAVLGLVALIGAVSRWQLRGESVTPAEADLAAPYRSGLHAAVRMQAVAQDLEQQLYAEAMRLSTEAEPSKNQPAEQA